MPPKVGWHFTHKIIHYFPYFYEFWQGRAWWSEYKNLPDFCILGLPAGSQPEARGLLNEQPLGMGVQQVAVGHMPGAVR